MLLFFALHLTSRCNTQSWKVGVDYLGRNRCYRKRYFLSLIPHSHIENNWLRSYKESINMQRWLISFSTELKFFSKFSVPFVVFLFVVVDRVRSKLICNKEKVWKHDFQDVLCQHVLLCDRTIVLQLMYTSVDEGFSFLFWGVRTDQIQNNLTAR